MISRSKTMFAKVKIFHCNVCRLVKYIFNNVNESKVVKRITNDSTQINVFSFLMLKTAVSYFILVCC